MSYEVWGEPEEVPECRYCEEAANEIERLREGLRIASAAVESLEHEVAAQRKAANEHRNAAMEADLRTQAAVRGEKQAIARLTAITRWLEANQPDVFRRGLWDAIETPNVEHNRRPQGVRVDGHVGPLEDSA